MKAWLPLTAAAVLTLGLSAAANAQAPGGSTATPPPTSSGTSGDVSGRSPGGTGTTVPRETQQGQVPGDLGPSGTTTAPSGTTMSPPASNAPMESDDAQRRRTPEMGTSGSDTSPTGQRRPGDRQ